MPEDTSAPVEAPQDEQSTTALSPAEELEAWFHRHIPNSVYSQTTEVYNRIYHAVAAIKDAISSVIKE